MNSTFLLLDEIRNRLKEGFNGIVFREPVNDGGKVTPNGEERYREPHFYVGAVPSKRHGELDNGDEQGEDVPFVLVKWLTSEITGEEPRVFKVSVGIVYVVFVAENNPEAGMHDLANMSDRIVMLLSGQRYWCDNYFVQELPIQVVQGTGKADNVYASGLQNVGPYYMGAVTTQFYAAALPQLVPPGIVDAAESAHPA